MSDDLLTKPLSLLERSPKDMKLNWSGNMNERWSIGVQCTIATKDEAEAVIAILSHLSEHSDVR